MQSKKELREQIITYLTSNPIKDTDKNKYSHTADLFKTDNEYIRSIWRTLKSSTPQAPSKLKKLFKSEYKENVFKGESDFTTITNKRIKTLEDLIQVCEIDLNEWSIVSWECNKWEVGRANKTIEWHIKEGQVQIGDVSDQGDIYVEPLYQVKAKLAKRKVDTDLCLQKDLLIKELYSVAPKFDVLDTFSTFRDSTKSESKERKGNCLLELCLFDPHFGKLAHSEESGKDEDIKITSTKYKEAIKSLISRVNIDSIERILLPIGNDMINVDGSNNTTTAGTPQTSDSRFYKIVRTVKELLIETINELAIIAPVDVVVVPGNHDMQTSFMIGEILDAYYHNTDIVTINNSARTRKYYQYGNNSIQFSHGNEEPHQVLGLIFATEEPLLWAETKFRFCQVGHFHKNKKTNYVSVDSHQGFSVQIIPSLSSADSWHYRKGYYSLLQAKAFMYDYNDGQVAEYTHTSEF